VLEAMSNNLFNQRTLKFPNARLFVHNQLKCGRAAPEAIAHSACEFGLLSHDAFMEVLPAPSAPLCPCLATAKNIVHKYCENSRNRPDGPNLDERELWDVLKEDAQAFNTETSSQSSMENPISQHQCSKFAPVLFDLLLQELIRHPD
jgi:hypothetical protein